MTDIKEFLIKMANMSGVSGYESPISKAVAEEFAHYCDEVTIDPLGSVIARKKGTGHKIMLAAHMDEIGLMVTEYEDKGFLRFANMGGVDPRAIVSQEVIIHGKEDVYGVIGVKPPHITKPEEAKNAHKIEDMAIDAGLENARDIVSIGDVVTVKRSVSELQNGLLTGKAMDDRAGLAVLLACMKELKNTYVDADVYYVGTVQEEIGGRGAATSAYGIMPDIAIAIEVCHGKTPETKPSQTSKLGEGPAITVGSGVSAGLFQFLKKTAAENYLPVQIDSAPARTFTDVDIIQVIGRGAYAGVVAIPLKYMHTSVETLNMKDVYAAGKLLASFIKEICGKDLEETLCL